MVSKLSISWPMYSNLLNKLYWKIKQSDIKFEFVLGIPRGGLCIAQFLSHQLDIPLITNIPLHRIDKINNYLITDDLIETGNTFKKFNDNFSHRLNYKTAVLHMKEESPIKPDFIACDDIISNKCWIVYPYEKFVYDPEEEIKNHLKKYMG